MTAIVPLTTIAQAIQESKCYVSTDEQTQQWGRAVRAEAIASTTFLPILEQRVEIAISLCRQF